MMSNFSKIAAIVVFAAGWAGTASADLIAGWDFSQYRADNTLDSGAGPADTLPANYSALDPTRGAGVESAAFGTLFMNGANGSTNVTEAAANPEVVARAHPTEANRETPMDQRGAALIPWSAFDEFGLLASEGQVNQERTALTARAAANLTFQADAGAPLTGSWMVRFAGLAIDPVGNVDVDVDFAADCAGFANVGTVTLTTDERQFELPVSGNITDDEVCVRLNLDPTNGQPVIDNVALLPEPGIASMLGAGALGLALLERRRRA
jgi:hypothetical protein